MASAVHLTVEQVSLLKPLTAVSLLYDLRPIKNYMSLADNAILESDYESASKYILQAIDADPTQINAPSEINEFC